MTTLKKILLGQFQINLAQIILELEDSSFFSNKGPRLFPRGDNSENTLTTFKITFLHNHWANFNQAWNKVFFDIHRGFTFFHAFPKGEITKWAKTLKIN